MADGSDLSKRFASLLSQLGDAAPPLPPIIPPSIQGSSTKNVSFVNEEDAKKSTNNRAFISRVENERLSSFTPPGTAAALPSQRRKTVEFAVDSNKKEQDNGNISPQFLKMKIDPPKPKISLPFVAQLVQKTRFKPRPQTRAVIDQLQQAESNVADDVKKKYEKLVSTMNSVAVYDDDDGRSQKSTEIHLAEIPAFTRQTEAKSNTRKLMGRLAHLIQGKEGKGADFIRNVVNKEFPNLKYEETREERNKTVIRNITHLQLLEPEALSIARELIQQHKSHHAAKKNAFIETAIIARRTRRRKPKFSGILSNYSEMLKRTNQSTTGERVRENISKLEVAYEKKQLNQWKEEARLVDEISRHERERRKKKEWAEFREKVKQLQDRLEYVTGRKCVPNKPLWKIGQRRSLLAIARASDAVAKTVREELEVVLTNFYATRVQRAWRGVRARRKFKELLQEYRLEKMGKRHFDHIRELQDAQEAADGFILRQRFRDSGILADWDIVRDFNAGTDGTNNGRVDFRNMERKGIVQFVKAAATIQNAFRTRRFVKKVILSIEILTAVYIQAWWRGVRVRNKLYNQRQIHAIERQYKIEATNHYRLYKEWIAMQLDGAAVLLKGVQQLKQRQMAVTAAERINLFNQKDDSDSDDEQQREESLTLEEAIARYALQTETMHRAEGEDILQGSSHLPRQSDLTQPPAFVHRNVQNELLSELIVQAAEFSKTRSMARPVASSSIPSRSRSRVKTSMY